MVLYRNIFMLLNVISKLPNSEVLLQKHFMVILSVVWILKYLCCHVTDIHSGAVDTFSPPKKSSIFRKEQSMANCRPCKLVKKAIEEAQAEIQ
jgi:E1A-binding protein p400